MPDTSRRRIAILLAGALTLTGAAALWHGMRLQSELDAWDAIAQVREVLSRHADAPRSELAAALRRLVLDPALGLVALSWTDARGATVQVARSEAARLPLLREDWSRRIADAAYRLGSRRGRVRLSLDGARSGVLEYRYRDAMQARVHDQAVARLRWFGAVTLLSGLGLLGLLLAATRRRKDPELLVRRAQAPTEAPPRAVPTPAPVDPFALIDALGVGVVVVDDGLRIERINAAAARMAGWPAAECLGRLVYSVIHPVGGQGQPLPVPVEQALASGTAVTDLSASLRARDGSLLPVEMDAAAADASGRAILLIRDRREQAASLRRREREAEMARLMLDHAESGLLLVDGEGIVRQANASACALFGLRASEIIGTPLRRLLPVPFMNSPGISPEDYGPDTDPALLPRVIGWRKDGSTFAAALQVRTLPTAPETLMLAEVRVERRRRADSAALTLGRVLDHSPLHVLRIDAMSRRLLEANAAAADALGLDGRRLRATVWDAVLVPPPGRTAVELVARLQSDPRQPLHCRLAHRGTAGEMTDLDVFLVYARDEDPPQVLLLGLPLSAADQSPESSSR